MGGSWFAQTKGKGAKSKTLSLMDKALQYSGDSQLKISSLETNNKPKIRHKAWGIKHSRVRDQCDTSFWKEWNLNEKQDLLFSGNGKRLRLWQDI